MKRQRNYQAIRNSVKETVSLLLKNKSYCHVLPFWERLHHHESSKTFIAYHLWKGRLQWCRTVWYDPGISRLVASSERSKLLIYPKKSFGSNPVLFARPSNPASTRILYRLFSCWNQIYLVQSSFLFVLHYPSQKSEVMAFFFLLDYRLVNSTKKDRTTCPLLQRDMPPSMKF